MARYVKVETLVSGPQRVLFLIDSDDVIEGDGLIDVTDRPEIDASSWYDMGLGDFVGAPPEPAPKPPTSDEVATLRRIAYAAESDPLKNEIEYDALIAGIKPDYNAWIESVTAIKLRYPMPD